MNQPCSQLEQTCSSEELCLFRIVLRPLDVPGKSAGEKMLEAGALHDRGAALGDVILLDTL